MYILLLPFHSTPSLFLFLMKFSNHCIEIIHIIPSSLVDRTLSKILFAVKKLFLFLACKLIRDDAPLNFLILKCHFLNVLSNLIDPPPQSFIHFLISITFDSYRLLDRHVGLNLCFYLLPLLPQFVKLRV